MIAASLLAILAALAARPAADLEAARAALDAFDLARVFAELEAVPDDLASRLVEVRALHAAGRYTNATERALDGVLRFGDADPESLLQLEFWAGNAALWARDAESALEAVDAMESRLAARPIPPWLEPYHGDWTRTAEGFRSQAEDLLEARDDLDRKLGRARATVIGAVLLAGLAVALVVRPGR